MKEMFCCCPANHSSEVLGVGSVRSVCVVTKLSNQADLEEEEDTREEVNATNPIESGSGKVSFRKKVGYES